MTADHAKAIADYFAAMFDRESANTLKVLRAVPNDRRDYKPDEKSRTAWELATHLAGSDLWFLDSVCDAVFVYDPEVENKRTAGLNTIDDVIEFYNREYSKRIQRLRSTPGELAKEVDFFGVTKGLPADSRSRRDRDGAGLRLPAQAPSELRRAWSSNRCGRVCYPDRRVRPWRCQ
jgi:hypothetical protein